MPVISFANAKGGAGKTTAALLLACELVRSGKRVTVLDADPQHWISQWYEATPGMEGLSVISEVTVASLHCHIREMGDRTDYIIIDLAGARDALTTAALSLSDHVFIPVQGSAMDARGGAQILDLISFLKEKTGLEISHSVVLTRVASILTTRALLTIKGMLAARGDMAILLVEQYYDFAKSLADTYCVMSRGEVVKTGRGDAMDADGVRELIAV